MLHRSSIALAALAAVLLLTAGSAQAFDESKYPDWKGQWRRAEPGPPRYDPSKPGTGFRQEAPLTEEYKAVLEASLADQKDGATLDGHDFEDHFQDPALQFLRFLNPVDRRADSSALADELCGAPRGLGARRL